MNELGGINSAIFQDIKAEAVPASKDLGRDEFLKLLTIQLRTQNPMEPTSNEEFVAQLATFSQLEQLTDIREAVEAQIDTNLLLTQSINNTSATGLIGKTVRTASNTVHADGSGSAVTLGYNLFAAANKVTVKIFDAGGNLVRTLEPANGKKGGDNMIEWDGKDYAGTRVREGNYRYTVEAKTADGAVLETTPYSVGRVSSVRFRPEGTILLVGGVETALGSVTDVME